jgi:Zn-dependent membrane protease YugP
MQYLTKANMAYIAAVIIFLVNILLKRTGNGIEALYWLGLVAFAVGLYFQYGKKK